MSLQSSHFRLVFIGAAAMSVGAIACSSGSTSKTGSDTATVAAAATSAAGVEDSASANHKFLREMSDHHKGLIAMVHATLDRKDVPGIMVDAKKLDAEQDADLDTMTIMLRQSYNDPYDPKIMPEHQAMIDSLLSLKGAAFERAFRKDVIRHHTEGLAMMDEYLPKLTDPKVKAMAGRMRAEQAVEITELQRQISQH